jgi:hypothetical protein
MATYGLDKHVNDTGPRLLCSTNMSQVDVCVFIDPLHDFLSPSGAFCKAYGEEDCASLLSVRHSMNQLYQHLQNYCPSVNIIVVSSVYKPNQFKTIPTLCTTREGRRVMFDSCVVNEDKDKACGNQIHLQKTDNSFLCCSEESQARIKDLSLNRNVMVCGVTTVSCVAKAVHDLCHSTGCNKVIIAQNTVASRTSNADRESLLLQEWVDKYGHEDHKASTQIEVHDKWETLFDIPSVDETDI